MRFVLGAATADAEGEWVAEPNRYRLYIVKSCPFAHRPRILRVLLGLEEEVAITEAQGQDMVGFFFDPVEPNFGKCHLKDIYTELTERHSYPPVQRYSVPLLVDCVTKKGISNESLDLCWHFVELYHAKNGNVATMKDVEIIPVAPDICLKIPNRLEEQEALLKEMEEINENIVLTPYKFLFGDAAAKEHMRSKMYEELAKLEQVVDKQTFLGGRNTLSMADCVLWPALFRFDNVYARQFGLSGKTLREDFPKLHGYVTGIYQGVATIKNDGDLESVVRLYWQSEILSKTAGNDPKADVPPVMDFM